MFGLATLALWKDEIDDVPRLKGTIIAALGREEAPDQELRDRAARDIRRRAKTLYRQGHAGSSIENAMSRINPDKVEPLLVEIADLLSPTTAGEQIHSDFFS